MYIYTYIAYASVYVCDDAARFGRTESSSIHIYIHIYIYIRDDDDNNDDDDNDEARLWRAESSSIK